MGNHDGTCPKSVVEAVAAASSFFPLRHKREIREH